MIPITSNSLQPYFKPQPTTIQSFFPIRDRRHGVPEWDISLFLSKAFRSLVPKVSQSPLHLELLALLVFVSFAIFQHDENRRNYGLRAQG